MIIHTTVVEFDGEYVAIVADSADGGGTNWYECHTVSEARVSGPARLSNATAFPG